MPAVGEALTLFRTPCATALEVPNVPRRDLIFIVNACVISALEQPGNHHSSSTALSRPKAESIALCLTDAMHALLRELEVCLEGYLFIEFPDQMALDGLMALRLIDSLPSGLRGHRIKLTARGARLLNALPGVGHCPVRAWWVVQVQELGTFHFFGTRAEAETHGLDKRWEFGGSQVRLRLARREELLVNRLRLERRESSGEPLTTREREALRSVFLGSEGCAGGTK